MLRSRLKINIPTLTATESQQLKTLAIEAAKKNDHDSLQVLLGIKHHEFDSKIKEEEEKSQDSLADACIAYNPSWLRAEFYQRVIKVLEDFNSKSSFDPSELSDALDAIFKEMENHAIAEYQDNMTRSEKGLLNEKLVALTKFIENTTTGATELDQSDPLNQEVLQYFKNKILAPFLAEMETMVSPLKNKTKATISTSLAKLKRDYLSFESLFKTHTDDVMSIQLSAETLEQNYDLAKQLNTDRVWRALPKIRRLLNPSAPPLDMEGKTKKEIEDLADATLGTSTSPAMITPGSPAFVPLSPSITGASATQIPNLPTTIVHDPKTVIAALQAEIDTLKLEFSEVPVETVDSRGYTLLFLVAKAESITASSGREFDKIINRLKTMELLLKDYKANPFIHAPSDPKKTLFRHFTVEVKNCNYSFLRILYYYAEKNYPEYKILEGGLDAVSPHPDDKIKQDIQEIKDHVISYKNEKIDHPSAFRSFIEDNFPILKTAPGRRNEVQAYLDAINYVEKYLDMDLLIIVIDEFSKPRAVDRGFTGASSLHDPIKKIGDTHSNSEVAKPPALGDRELQYTTGLVSLIGKIQEYKKVVQQVEEENMALKVENAALKAENSALKAENMRLKGATVTPTSLTTLPSTSAWPGTSSSSSLPVITTTVTSSPSLTGGGSK